ncbi:MAG: hypothetical protein EZS28_025531 [Streblomastix strix]|uniref:DDE-1 domain-containing protein n=1 Tax=Streblomastix strix TaxID=222440 RepID=A0A5J4V933_9EUKA|nr:MAG: hypothetical protein EZS28_025531 [Streblomastix strix]
MAKMVKLLLSTEKGIQVAKDAPELIETQPGDTIVKQIVRCITDEQIPRRYFIDAFPERRTAITAAIKAFKEGRDIGVLGRPPILNLKESKELMTRIENENIAGANLDTDDVNQMGQDILNNKKDIEIKMNSKENEINQISRFFAYNFRNRQERLKTKIMKMREIKRILAECQESIKPLSDLLQKLHNDNNYKPALIFNFDETPIRLSSSLKRLIYYIERYFPSPIPAPPRMPNATILPCVSSIGAHLTTFLIWPSMSIPPELKDLLAYNIQIICEGVGWVTKKMLVETILPVWEKEIIELRQKLQLPADSRALILLDSHGSQNDIPNWNLIGKRSFIDVVTFVSHSTAKCQPLDQYPNAALKRVLNRTFKSKGSPKIKDIRESLCLAIIDAVNAALERGGIVRSFHECGVLKGEQNNLLSVLPVKPALTQQLRENALVITRRSGFPISGKKKRGRPPKIQFPASLEQPAKDLMSLRSADCICLGYKRRRLNSDIENSENQINEKEKDINIDKEKDQSIEKEKEMTVEKEIDQDLNNLSNDDFEELFYSEESVIPDTDDSYQQLEKSESSMSDISIPLFKKRKRRRPRQCDGIYDSSINKPSSNDCEQHGSMDEFS